MREISFHIHTGHPLLDGICNGLVDLFLAPGDIMMRSLAATPWGQDWGIHPDWPLVVMVAVFFWAILLTLLGAANDSVRQMLARCQKDE
jgi:hypothetical protein